MERTKLDIPNDQKWKKICLENEVKKNLMLKVLRGFRQSTHQLQCLRRLHVKGAPIREIGGEAAAPSL